MSLMKGVRGTGGTAMKMKIGARVIKTGLAVIVALYVSMALGLHPPVFAAIAAVISIQPSVYRSITTFYEQIKANLIGAAFALGMSLTVGNSPLMVGLTVIIVISINLLLKYEKSISISVLTAIAIMESGEGFFLEYSLKRFSLIAIGMLAATVINALFMPPKHEGKLVKLIEETNDRLTLLLLDRHTTSYTEQKNELREKIEALEQLFEVYQEEVFFRKYSYAKKRELVTYKRMISLFKRELKLLRQFKRMKAEALIKEMDHKLVRIVDVQRRLLHQTRIELEPLVVGFDMHARDQAQIRSVSLITDIELELNKMLRYKRRMDDARLRAELGISGAQQ